MEGRTGGDALLLAPADLPAGESDRIAVLLVRRDPGEDAIELRVILRDRQAGSTRPLARIVTVPSSASPTSASAPRRRRVATEFSST